MASFLILDGAAARQHHRATCGCPRARFGEIALEAPVDERATHQGCRKSRHEALAHAIILFAVFVLTSSGAGAAYQQYRDRRMRGPVPHGSHDYPPYPAPTVGAHDDDVSRPVLCMPHDLLSGRTTEGFEQPGFRLRPCRRTSDSASLRCPQPLSRSFSTTFAEYWTGSNVPTTKGEGISPFTTCTRRSLASGDSASLIASSSPAVAASLPSTGTNILLYMTSPPSPHLRREERHATAAPAFRCEKVVSLSARTRI